MLSWNMDSAEEFNRDAKWYEKKKRNEFVSVMRKVDKYYKALCSTGNPLQVNGKFIHNENSGLYALDETGGKKKQKPEAETRSNKVIYLSKY